MEPAPFVDDLSAAQLRVVAHIRGARPAAVFCWRRTAAGWSLEVTETRRGRPPRQVASVFLAADGSVEATSTLL